MNKDELRLKLIDIVGLQKFHNNYTRTVELSELYNKLIGGKDIDTLLRQFVRREDNVLFEQRKTLTQQITPSICSTIMKTFNKVFRTNPAVEVIDFDGENVESKIEEVKKAVDNIYGGKDIYKYFQDRMMYLSFTDPNAFVYTTFSEFDAKREKPQPFNQEIPSYQAMNYEYINNVLQWLIQFSPIKFKENNTIKNGGIYTIYSKEWTLQITQVGSDYVVLEGQEKIVIKRDADNVDMDMHFIYVEYNHKSEEIPVIQIGYERDMDTQGETFVSPIHSGVPYLMKLVKAVSEFDLTMCLHAFPQKFQYVDACTFKPDSCCSTSGKPQAECTMCNKTGFKVHTSAQDAQLFKMPKDPEDMMNLSEIIHYEQPPIDILSFQKEIITEWSTDVIKAVFNSERFTKDQVAKTATGENVDMQNVYDTLKPFAEKISDVWVHIAKVVSYYLDYKNPIAYHSYPNDFKLKTTSELLDEMTKAKDTSGYIVSAIETDIMRQKFIDNPLEFQKYEIKSKFFPFKGKTRDEIGVIINSGIVRQEDIILYNYFETIFAEIEDELLAGAEKVWFYDMTAAMQKEQIRKKIEQIKGEINSQNAIVLG